MRASFFVALLSSFAGSALAINEAAVVAALSPRALQARQAVASGSSSDNSSTSSIQGIISLITPSCNSTCSLFTTDLAGCAQLQSTTAIAECACSSQTLGDIRSCAACVARDNSTSNANHISIVSDYNSFVNLCVSEGLASVTGTVAVGESTTSLTRTILTPTSRASGATSITTSIPLNATYDVSKATMTATDVASLVDPAQSGASTAAGSASSAKSSTPASAASSLKASAVGLIGVFALFACLA